MGNDKCDCEAVLSACSLEREVLMSATEETKSSGSDKIEIHHPEVGELKTQKKALLAM